MFRGTNLSCNHKSEPFSFMYGVPQGSDIICLPMTQSCTIQLLALALIRLSETTKTFRNNQNFQRCQKWTIHHKLHLNEDETEALLFDPSRSSDFPDVLKIGQYDIPFCNSSRNLRVMSGNGFTMKQQVDRICQTAYSEIQRNQFLITEATKLLLYLLYSRV